ncbi:hypothetical protein Plec18170_008778, partial [Paecilomyces lecythidis]
MDLTKDRLPEIQSEPDRCTGSSAVHTDLKFNGRLVPWKSFEQDVHDVFRKVFKNPITRKKLHVVLSHPGEDAISNEHYLCGEELSSSGRYVQHALHVMTAVGNDLGFKLRFGDWYTSYKHERASGTRKKSGAGSSTSDVQHNTRNNRIIPDYALLAENPDDEDASYARALGEAKSPYGAHDLASWVQDAYKSKDEKLRKLL